MLKHRTKRGHQSIKRPNESILSIVIPVFNERDNFPETYRKIQEQISVSKQIFVVYDFDEDNTVPVVEKYLKNDRDLHLVKNEIGAGPHNAIKSGFKKVTSGPILVMMGDLCDDLSIVDAMYQQWLEGSQVVCASRYMRGGKQIGGPLLKRSLSRIAGNSLYYLRGIPTHDITNNFRMYDAGLIQGLTIDSKGGFEIAMEITIKAFQKGQKITEIPTVWRDREAGESNFKFRQWLPSYLHWYLTAIFKRVIPSGHFTHLPTRTYKKLVKNTPLPCVDVIPVKNINNTWYIGVIERATGPEAGKLAVIGGRIALHESITEAIERHLRDDLTIISGFSFLKGNSDSHPFYLQQYYYNTKAKSPYVFDPTKQAVTPTYLVSISGTPKPKGEARKYRWITLEGVPETAAYNQDVVMREAFRLLVANRAKEKV